MLSVNTNIAALNAHRQAAMADIAIERNLVRLSSGKRINSASDDAAGLAIVEGMKAQSIGLSQAQRNIQDGVSLCQVADGGLSGIMSTLQRVRQLAVEAATGSLTSNDLNSIQSEIDQLLQCVDDLARTTTFNSIPMLTGGATISGSNTAQKTVKVSAKSPFTDTGLTVQDGNQLTISVTGTARWDRYSLPSDPSGVATPLGAGSPEPGSPVGKVIGKIGNGTPFAVGSNYPGPAGGSGELYLGVNDLFGAYGDNSGFYTATITVSSQNQHITPLKLQVGPNAGDVINVRLSDVTTSELRVNGLTVSTNNDTDPIATLDAAIQTVSSEQAYWGAMTNRLQSANTISAVTQENMDASRTKIEDADMAQQVVALSSSQIVQQSSQAMITQATQKNSRILKLLSA